MSLGQCAWAVLGSRVRFRERDDRPVCVHAHPGCESERRTRRQLKKSAVCLGLLRHVMGCSLEQSKPVRRLGVSYGLRLAHVVRVHCGGRLSVRAGYATAGQFLELCPVGPFLRGMTDETVTSTRFYPC